MNITAREPYEAYYAKYGEQEEDDTTSILLSVKIIDRSCESKGNVQDPSDPNELLGERSCHCEISPRKHKGHDKDEGEQDDSVRV